MELPPFAPFPPVGVRKDIIPDEWELCLDAWLLLAQRYLLLPAEVFSSKVLKDASVSKFLTSYVESNAQNITSENRESKSSHLRRTCFLLIHRILVELKHKPTALLESQFLFDLSIVYSESSSLKSLLHTLWQTEPKNLSERFQRHKTSLIRMIEEATGKDEHSELEKPLARTAALLKACPAYGQFLMLGSDFVDALTALYASVSSSLQRRLVVVNYRCFLSLLDPSNPKYSMLLDHLYALDSSSRQDSLLAATCSNTPFVRRLQRRIAGPEAIRAEKLIQHLSAYEGKSTLPLRRRRRAQPKADKGKERQQDEYGHGAMDGNLHVHKMSLVTQIQDLFPDLGSGFVMKLLDEYEDNTEQVTAHLLDDSLPPYLKKLDRNEEMYESHALLCKTQREKR